jgi:hypothetical protein
MENDALRTKVAAHSRERSQSTLVMYEDLIVVESDHHAFSFYQTSSR